MIEVIALDIGGVLAYVDESALSSQERYLLYVYLNRIEIPVSFKKDVLIEVEEKINGIYQKLYIPMDSTFSTLEFLKQKNYLISLWTNNKPAIKAWIKSSGIDKFLTPLFLCNSCDMKDGVNKPNPEFYHYALKRIHYSPNQVLFIDDNLKNVQSAEGVGIEILQHQQENNLQEEIKEKIKVLERKSL